MIGARHIVGRHRFDQMHCIVASQNACLHRRQFHYFIGRVRTYEFDLNGRRYICEIKGKARRAGWYPGQGV